MFQPGERVGILSKRGSGRIAFHATIVQHSAIMPGTYFITRDGDARRKHVDEQLIVPASSRDQLVRERAERRAARKAAKSA